MYTSSTTFECECERTTKYCMISSYSQWLLNLKLSWNVMLKATFTNYFLNIKNIIFKEKYFLNIHCAHLIRSLGTKF